MKAGGERDSGGKGDTRLSRFRGGRFCQWPVEGKGPWEKVSRGVREVREGEENCRLVWRADGG